MYHALVGGEHGFGLGPCQPGDHDLFADVKRAQVLFVTRCGSWPWGFLPGETPLVSRKFLKCAYAARFHISSSKSRLPLDELVK